MSKVVAIAGVTGAVGQELLNCLRSVLALDQRGILLHIDANPKSFDLLSEVKLETPSTWAHLAVCGAELYVRHLKGLNVYRWK